MTAQWDGIALGYASLEKSHTSDETDRSPVLYEVLF